ncbi:MAG TPA: NAD-dependent epimerase/dehydratase family protein [Trebonia sp.]|jgi:NAD(P)-dependent dehydrogenase (short-subunit alcohol dehydrogenase family)|nr:NAD-dependent epimerase/dehydratase family protein [Trebonia sp.]
MRVFVTGASGHIAAAVIPGLLSAGHAVTGLARDGRKTLADPGRFQGRLTEQDALPGGPRIDAENFVIALAGQGVRSSVVRLPPTVHSRGRSGFISGLIAVARANFGYLGPWRTSTTTATSRPGPGPGPRPRGPQRGSASFIVSSGDRAHHHDARCRRAGAHVSGE